MVVVAIWPYVGPFLSTLLWSED